MMQAGNKINEYTDLLNGLRHDLKAFIPTEWQIVSSPKLKLFQDSCRSVEACLDAKEAADSLRRDGRLPDSSKDAANALYEKASKALEQAQSVALECATQEFLNPHQNDLAEKLSKFCQSKLVRLAILAHGTPQRLGEFANRGQREADLVDNFLLSQQHVGFQKAILMAGGAKHGEYGAFLDIYTRIFQTSRHLQSINLNQNGNLTTNYADAVLDQVALAVALEYAVPKAEFSTPDIHTNPVDRYLHYEAAYLADQLDVNFENFTPWQYRMVIDGDAPNDQLEWCRTMMKNYRPDEILMDDMVWRYCRSVRTEVGYRRPEWTSDPHTYMQLISGGGECGPRAWFGRFSCKAFGIPTWGVRQPGHAAMTHWTPDPKGWVVCLGADWPFCTWDGRVGPDFHLETLARSLDGNEEQVFYDTVTRLQFVADILKEGPLNAGTGIVNSKSPLRSLALMQTKILAARHHIKDSAPIKTPAKHGIQLQKPNVQKDTIEIKNNGTIVIPAASCSNPTQNTDTITFMPSFLEGGSQVNIREKDTLEYTITLDGSHIALRQQQYQATLRVCTVHLKQDPILITIHNTSSSSSPTMVGVASVTIPYTIGEWQTTDPVPIDLSAATVDQDGSAAKDTATTLVLTLTRNNASFGGLTIKDITLTPVDCSTAIMQSDVRAVPKGREGWNHVVRWEDQVEGTFIRHPVENKWHTVTVKKSTTEQKHQQGAIIFTWRNEANVSWDMKLFYQQQQEQQNERTMLHLGSDCCYFHQGQTKVYVIEDDDGVVTGLLFQGEVYKKEKQAHIESIPPNDNNTSDNTMDEAEECEEPEIVVVPLA